MDDPATPLSNREKIETEIELPTLRKDSPKNTKKIRILCCEGLLTTTSLKPYIRVFVAKKPPRIHEFLMDI